MYFFRINLFLNLLAFSFSSVADGVWDQAPPGPEEAVEITVYRSPNCGCCGIWLEHMKQHNFVVTDIKSENMNAIKQQYGVRPELASCHTAVVDGYVIEGHVPAADVRKLLTEKPARSGIAVPGMPVGTPGMEMGGQKQPFSVISFDQKGQELFTEYRFY